MTIILRAIQGDITANGWNAQQAGAPFQMDANACAFMPEYG
jgi:hypothetical protein